MRLRLSPPSQQKRAYIRHVPSFEWYFGLKSWQASVHLWGTDSYYRHTKSGERILAEAGWHCTYCFRTIADYMEVGRSRGLEKLTLDPKSIQDAICHGKDLFGMFPEAYSVSSFFIFVMLVGRY